MTDSAEEFVDLFLEHAGMTKEEKAAYNREYYLRNRKLKGRYKAQNPASGFKKSTSSMPKSGSNKNVTRPPVIKGPTKAEQARVRALQDKLIKAKRAAEKAPPAKKKGLLDKIRNIEKKIESSKAGKFYKSTEKGYDRDLRDAPGVIKELVQNPSKANLQKLYDNFDLGQGKRYSYKDRLKFDEQDRRLAEARKSVKKLPPDKRNAVEKKIDAAQKKLNKLNPFKSTKTVKTRVIPKDPKITGPSKDLPVRVAKIKKQLADARKAAEKEKKSPLGKLRAFEKRVDAIEKKLNKKATSIAKKPFKSDKEWVNKQIRKDPNGWVANMERMKAKQARRKAATNDRQR